jgi:hypothetical protein
MVKQHARDLGSSVEDLTFGLSPWNLIPESIGKLYSPSQLFYPERNGGKKHKFAPVRFPTVDPGGDGSNLIPEELSRFG